MCSVFEDLHTLELELASFNKGTVADAAKVRRGLSGCVFTCSG